MYRDELIADLESLVNAESPSNDPAALARSAAAVAAVIERRIGSSPEFVDGPNGPHIRWSGGPEPAVLLLGHHDTVFPLGTLDRRPFTVSDGRATGPGIFDMKAGIVQAIHAVASLEDRSGVEMLFSCDEEIGSLTSRTLIEQRAQACGAVLVLEPSADGGALKNGRKGVGVFEVVVHGVAAHAGLEPERGANAVIEIAHQIEVIGALADPARATTVTPTVCHAGTADNVVPAEARLRVDVRVLDLDEADRLERAFSALAGAGSTDPRCRIEILGGMNRPPMNPSMAESLLRLVHEVEPGLAAVTVGGGSDGNFTAALGIPTLDGFGAVGGGAHADHEWVDVTVMPDRAIFLARVIDRVVATRH